MKNKERVERLWRLLKKRGGPALRVLLATVIALWPDYLGVGVISAQAQAVPSLMNFQGRLTDSSNNPLAGTYPFIFQIFDNSVGGNLLWSETQPSVTVVNGVFAVQLGASTPLTTNILSGSTAYLQVTANGNTMSPRSQLITSPYAFNAQLLQGRTYQNFVSTDSSAQMIGGVKTFVNEIQVPSPVNPGDAASKAYVDASVGGEGGWTLVGTVAELTNPANYVVIQSSLTVQGGALVQGGLTASTAALTGTGATTFSLNTSSGINVQGTGGVVAAFFSGAHVGNGAGLTNVPPAGNASGDLTGTYPGPTFNLGNAHAWTVSQAFNATGNGTYGLTTSSGINVGQGVVANFFVGNGGALTNVPPAGGAGGDLSGTYPSPTLNLGNAHAWTVSQAFNATGNATYGLTTSSGISVGQGVSANFFAGNGAALTNVPPAGSASGDLTGTYPGPTFNLGNAHAWTVSQAFNATGNATYGLTTSSGISVGQGVVANFFVGNGEGLTNVPGTVSGGAANNVPVWAGSNSLGQSHIWDQNSPVITTTMTVLGGAFSVAGSTLVIAGGSVGIGTSAPTGPLHVLGANTNGSNAAPITLITGSVVGGGSGGNIVLTAGNGTGGGANYGGSILLTAGAGSGAGGGISLAGGQGGGGGSQAGGVTIFGGTANAGSSAGGLNLVGGNGTGNGPGGGAAIFLGPGSAANNGNFKVGLAGGTTEFFINGTNNNVGVGTIAPATLFDVNGSAQFGSGVAKSTFTAAPGGASYALQLSSGVTIASGGPLILNAGGFIQFPDGTTQTTSPSGATGGWTQAGAVSYTGNNVVVESTLTVQGTAFSVGGSNLVVSGADVGVGTTAPQTLLDVNGAAQFGLGVNKSTFSAAGGLTFAAGYSPVNAQDAVTLAYAQAALTTVGLSTSAIAASTTTLQTELVAVGLSTQTIYSGVGVSTHNLQGEFTAVGLSTQTIYANVGVSTTALQGEFTAVGLSTQTIYANVGASTTTLQGEFTAVGLSTQTIYANVGASTTTLQGELTAVGLSTQTIYANVGASTTTLNTLVVHLAGSETITGAKDLRTISSTMTIQGNAFSVGGSSFTVGGGSATVAYQLLANSGDFTQTGNSNYSLFTSSGIDVGAGPLYLNGGGFIRFPDGSTQATASAASGGWSQVGALTYTSNNVVSESTLTVQGNAFSVGGSSFTVIGGSATAAFQLGGASGNFTQTGNSNYSLFTSSGINMGSGTLNLGNNEACLGGVCVTSFSGVGGGAAGWNQNAPMTFTSNNVVVESTLTVQGNAFSVGGGGLILTGGSVGIGTTGPGHALDVEGGDGKINALNALCIAGTCETAVASGQGVGGTGSQYYDAVWGLAPGAVQQGYLYEASNMVGIGNNSPLSMFSVTPNNTVTGTISSQAGLGFNALTLQGPGGALNTKVGLVASWNGNAVGLASGLVFGRMGNNFGTYVALHTHTNGGGADVFNEVMRADMSGNIGIGTTAPGAQLDVEGSNNVILNAGSVGISTGSPQTTLDVNGSASFGTGINKSTFSATGGLTFASSFAPANPQDAVTVSYEGAKFTNVGLSTTSIAASTTTFQTEFTAVGLSTQTIYVNVGASTTTLAGMIGGVNLSTTAIAASTTTLQAEIVAVGASTQALNINISTETAARITAITAIGLSTQTIYVNVGASTTTLQAEIVAVGASTQTIYVNVGASTNTLQTEIVAVGASTQALNINISTETVARIVANVAIGLSTQTIYANVGASTTTLQGEFTAVGLSTQTIYANVGASTTTLQGELTAVGLSTQTIYANVGASTTTLQGEFTAVGLSTQTIYANVGASTNTLQTEIVAVGASTQALNINISTETAARIVANVAIGLSTQTIYANVGASTTTLQGEFTAVGLSTQTIYANVGASTTTLQGEFTAVGLSTQTIYANVGASTNTLQTEIVAVGASTQALNINISTETAARIVANVAIGLSTQTIYANVGASTTTLQGEFTAVGLSTQTIYANVGASTTTLQGEFTAVGLSTQTIYANVGASTTTLQGEFTAVGLSTQTIYANVGASTTTLQGEFTGVGLSTQTIYANVGASTNTLQTEIVAVGASTQALNINISTETAARIVANVAIGLSTQTIYANVGASTTTLQGEFTAVGLSTQTIYANVGASTNTLQTEIVAVGASTQALNINISTETAARVVANVAIGLSTQTIYANVGASTTTLQGEFTAVGLSTQTIYANVGASTNTLQTEILALGTSTTTIAASTTTLNTLVVHLAGSEIITGAKDLRTISSTMTVQGNAFSVGGSTFVIVGSSVGIGTLSPASKLHMSSGTLTIDGSAPYSIVANGMVGIGTSGPTESLQVVGGNIRTNNSIYAQWNYLVRNQANNADLLAINMSGGDLMQFGMQSSIGGLQFAPGGTTVARFTPAGNFGIGTTNPANTFDINGGEIIRSSSTWVGLGSAPPLSASGQAGLYVNSSGQFQISQNGGAWAAIGAGGGGGGWTQLASQSYTADNVVVESTLTVQGSAFSVGGSTFVVSGGVVTAAGSVLFSSGTGGVPATGAGSRFEWIPSSAAIRAGNVSGTDWDAANIGAYSIAFGQDNTASNNFDEVLGGSGNTAASAAWGYDVVAGGQGNSANGGRAFIGGGDGNNASGNESVIAGGAQNTVSGGDATIGGGQLNNASSTVATVAGGSRNTASNLGATVAGGGGNAGLGNTASGIAATVGGGQSNVASGSFATIAGGGTGDGSANAHGGNTASGLSSAVGGGAVNTAAGKFAVVPGGAGNYAFGDYSFAGGFGATATARGSFVWSDADSGGLFANTTDQFILRAAGGFEAIVSSLSVANKSGAMFTVDGSSAQFKVSLYDKFGSLITGGVGGSSPWSEVSAGGVVDLNNASDNVVIQSTLTVLGGGFSVAGSTLAVAGGNVGIGTSNPSHILDLVSTQGYNTNGGREIHYEVFTNDSSEPLFKMFKARGTPSAPATVQLDDPLGAISFGGYAACTPGAGSGCDNGFRPAGGIYASAADNWSPTTNDMDLYVYASSGIILNTGGGTSIFDAKGQLGVGTATPDATLDVEGTNDIILNAGNVGIGTTNIVDPLTVVGTGGSGDVMILENPSNTSPTTIDFQDDAGVQQGYLGYMNSGFAYSPSSMIFGSSNKDIGFDTTGTASAPKMIIKAGGNVGLGTTAPQYRLHAQVAGDPWAYGGVFMTPATSNGVGWQTIGGNGGYGFDFYGTAYNKAYGTAEIQLSANSTLNFMSGNGNAPTTSYMYIDASGDVGIGTTAPNATLNVKPQSSANYALYVSSQNGGPFLAVSNLGNVGVGKNNPQVPLDVNGEIAIGGGATNVPGGMIYDSGTQTIQYYNGTAWIPLGTGSISYSGTLWNQNGTAVYYNSGYVGVGTTNPAAEFQVVNPADNSANPTFLVTSSPTNGNGNNGQNQPIFAVYDKGGAFINSYKNASAFTIYQNVSGQDALDIYAPEVPGMDTLIARFMSASTANGAVISIDNTSGGTSFQSSVDFDENGNTMFQIGTDVNDLGQQNFFIYDGVANQPRLLIDGNGDVGIGTTAPYATKYMTIGNGGQAPTAGAQGIYVDAPGTGGGIYMGEADVAAQGKYEVYQGRMGVGTISNHPLDLWTNNLPQMTITPAGFVGIGTTNPSSIFDLVTNIDGGTGTGAREMRYEQYSNADHGPNFRMEKGRGTSAAPAAVQPSDILGAVTFGGYGLNGGTGFQWGAAIQVSVDAAGSAADFGIFASSAIGLFSNGGSGGSIIMDKYGNVGIGNSTPGAALAIQYVLDPTDGNVSFFDDINNGDMAFDGGNDSSYWFTNYGTIAGGDTRFVWNNAGTEVPNLVIQNTGNVGIGTTGPGHALDVQGGDGYVNAATGFCIAGTCTTSFGGGLWGTDGTNIWNANAGLVGVGTTNPELTFSEAHEDGETAGEHLIAVFGREGDNGPDIDSGIKLGYFSDGTNPLGGLIRSYGGHPLYIGTTDQNQDITILDTNGFVGIGNSAPIAALSVGPMPENAATPWANIFMTQFPTAGGAQFVGNWINTGYWGIGPVSGNADNTLGIGVTTDETGDWSGTQDLQLVVGGAIGIGTTAPLTTFSIVSPNTSSDWEPVTIQATNNTGAATIDFLDDSNTFRGWIGYHNTGSGFFASGNVLLGTADSSTNLLLGTNGAEVMRISGAGQVGIGTTNPGALLDVEGGAVTFGGTGNALTLSGAGANIAFSGAGNDKITTAANNNLTLAPGGTGKVALGSAGTAFTKMIFGTCSLSATSCLAAKVTNFTLCSDTNITAASIVSVWPQSTIKANLAVVPVSNTSGSGFTVGCVNPTAAAITSNAVTLNYAVLVP
jgi:hypothetical protein